jgi:predicted dehydrogenase
MATTLRNPRVIALAGAGEQANRMWGPTLKQHEAGGILRFVSVADINTDAAGHFAERFDLRGSRTSSHYGGDDALRRMLTAEPEIGGIVIVGPHYSHAALALLALEFNVHVLVEKPMASTYVQALEMLDAADANEVILGVAYQYPWMVDGLRPAVAELGPIDRAYAWWKRRDGIPDRRSFWDSKETGGVGVDLLGHLLAAVLHLVEGSPEIVSARSWNDIGVAQKGPSFRAEDTLWASLDWPNEQGPGTRGSFEVSWASPITVDETIGVILEGKNGRIKIPLIGAAEDSENYLPKMSTRVFEPGGIIVATRQDFEPPPTVSECVHRLAQNWIGACTGQEELLFGPRKALKIQEVFKAMLESTLAGGGQQPLR